MKNLINSLFKTKPAPTPFLPENTRIYCIGDIHGRLDLITQLMKRIQYHAQHFAGKIIIVYLGDYIDRGPQSKGVIDFILHNTQPNMHYVYLRGNHEQTLLDFLHNEAVGKSWLSYGGHTTLASYGVAITKIPTKPTDFLALQSQLRAKLPATHYQFLLQTQLFYSVGSYFFVHAGINPHYSLAKQRPEDLLWIRDEFIHTKKPFEKIIVHGHTITDAAELLPHRIGIDTGAYLTGVLTSLALQGNQQRIIQTQPPKT